MNIYAYTFKYIVSLTNLTYRLIHLANDTYKLSKITDEKTKKIYFKAIAKARKTNIYSMSA